MSAAASPDRIADLLVERFATTPILTWRDSGGDYRDHLTDIESAVAERGYTLTTHVVESNELGTKCRVYGIVDGEPADDLRQLVYRTGPQPDRADNWLLDIEVGYGVFAADTAAILIHDLGLTDKGVNTVVEEHLGSFGAPGRLAAISERLTDVPDDRPAAKLADDLRAFLSAEILGLHGPGSHRLHRIVVALLTEYADDDDTGYQALDGAGLADFLWSGCAGIYGYTTGTPSVAGLATWIFNEAWTGWPQARNAARIDFERFRDDPQARSVFTTLAGRAQEDLNIAEHLRTNTPPVAGLADRNVFPIVDDYVIHGLAEAIHRSTMTLGEVDEIVRTRSATTWYAENEHSYAALRAAAECLSSIETFAPVIADPLDGITSYAARWASIDRAYRLFRHHIEQQDIEIGKGLTDRVEHRYVHDCQRPLAHAWQQQIDTFESWDIPGIQSLRGFARYDLPAKTKTLVIVSDAFRYEVGMELAERMNASDSFTATIEPRLSPLPSITCLGMAAMLPHDHLELANGETVLADGKSTSGLLARDLLWGKANIAATNYAEVMGLSAGERYELWREHEAVVVYHDTIDATGHKTPHQTPKACADALDDITRLIKRFGSGKMRASRVLVTADHGFLYQRSELAPSDYLSETAHGDEVVADGRRHVIGRGLRDHPSFTTWTSQQLGLDGDLEVQTPRGLHRLRKQGSGVQYVHGGTSLQEIVVPLVTLTQSRKNTTTKVTVDVNVSTPTITSSTVMVTLLQREPVSGKTRGRTLDVGVYAQDGTELSGRRKIVVDSTAADIRDRSTTIELVLNEDAETYNGQTVVIRADELVNDTTTDYQSTTATLQRGFGGFFDAL